MKEIVLASASPRRSELLKQVGVQFKVIPSYVDEEFDEGISPERLVQDLSYKKALDIAKKMKDSSLVIGADTVVVKERILGKPENREEAFKTLKLLQGRWHDVITGVTIIDSSTLNSRTSYEKTRVKMCELSDDKIESYINMEEPLPMGGAHCKTAVGKSSVLGYAGAYGIQGIGAILIEKIDGCYFNVVGLPLMKLSVMLEEFGVRLL